MKKHVIDIVNGKVYVDPTFVKKASKLGSAEFNEFMELKATLPGFIFEEKKLNAEKNTYKGLKIEVMEAFILFYEEGESQTKALAEFRKVVAEGTLKENKSSFVKSWFLSKYKEPYNKSSFAQKSESKKAQAIKELKKGATTVAQSTN